MGDDNIVWSIAVWLIPLVIAIVFHEVAHGLAARAFGDQTAARLGRLSFNPIRHVDPVGTVILPMILALAKAPVFGWAKPVPVVARRLRNPRVHMMLVALAGPGMNLLLAIVATLAFALVVAAPGIVPDNNVGRFLVENLYNFLLINIFLAVFNLIPLPPFDGRHVVEGLLPRSAVPAWQHLGRFAFPLLIVLLVVLPMLGPDWNIVAQAIGPIAGTVIAFFLGIAGLQVG